MDLGKEQDRLEAWIARACPYDVGRVLLCYDSRDDLVRMRLTLRNRKRIAYELPCSLVDAAHDPNFVQGWLRMRVREAINNG